MTRENKLALVVGFALILFIGILISDHFSVARNQVSANLANQPIADPLAAQPRDDPGLLVLKPPPAAPPPSAPLLQQGEPAVNPTNMGPVEPMTPEQRSMIDHSATLAYSSPRAGDAPATQSDPQRVPRNVEPVNDGIAAGNQAEMRTVTARESDQIKIKDFVPVREETTIKLKDMHFHDVHGGESLFAICKQYYGDTSLVKALAKFNNMDDPAQVGVGRKLMIPPAETLGGKPRQKAPSAAPDSSSEPTSTSLVKVTTETTKTPAKPKTYTVKAGDSLSLIAQRVLGDKEKWRDLHRLNRKVIDDPDNLKVGTVIRLL